MPAARQRSRSPLDPLAVSAMMGVRRPCPSRARIHAVALYPSISGIWQSMSTASHVSFSQAWTASSPFSTSL